jgi:hypothetical protein
MTFLWFKAYFALLLALARWENRNVVLLDPNSDANRMRNVSESNAEVRGEPEPEPEPEPDKSISRGKNNE